MICRCNAVTVVWTEPVVSSLDALEFGGWIEAVPSIVRTGLKDEDVQKTER